MANFYLFLVIYSLNHEENSENFERQFRFFFQILLDSWKYLQCKMTLQYNNCNIQPGTMVRRFVSQSFAASP